MSHPLDDTFDVDPSERVKRIFGSNIEIPDNPTMETVVKLALKQYESIANDAALMEGEAKIQSLELAEKYLNLAKDTMYKESDLGIKAKKVDATANKGKPKQVEDQSGHNDAWDEIEKIQKGKKK